MERGLVPSAKVFNKSRKQPVAWKGRVTAARHAVMGVASEGKLDPGSLIDMWLFVKT